MREDPVLDEKNPYRTLDVRKWVSDAEIKKAYIRLVKAYNPEVYPDQFIQIRRAYDLLRTPEKRAKIDLMLFNELPGNIGYRNLPRTTDSLVKINRQMKEIEESIGDRPPTDKGAASLLNLRRERSLIYADKRMWDEAIREWEEICKLDPKDRHSKRNRILSLSRLGYAHAIRENYKEAMACWRKILESHPDSTEIIHNIGIAYTLLKKKKQEMDYWRRILDRWNAHLKKNGDDLYVQSLILEAHKFFGGELLKKPIVEPTESTENVKSQSGSKRSAKALVPVVTEFKGFNGFAANRDLGLACMDRKNWDGAIQAFTKCLAENPEDVRALGYLGWAYLNSGDVNRPFHLWKKALRARPDDREIRDNIIRGHLKIGENLMKQRFFGPALVHLKSVLQMSPNNAKVYIEIGNIYMMRGDPQTAIQNWERASEIDPKNRDLKLTIRKAKASLGRS